MREVTGHQVAGALANVQVFAVDEGVAPSYRYTVVYRGLPSWLDENCRADGTRVTPEDRQRAVRAAALSGVGTRIDFQRGAVPEQGANGVTNEALLAIVLDRLRAFQVGPFACPENGHAIQHLAVALHCLQARTRDRVARGVVGQATK